MIEIQSFWQDKNYPTMIVWHENITPARWYGDDSSFDLLWQQIGVLQPEEARDCYRELLRLASALDKLLSP